MARRERQAPVQGVVVEPRQSPKANAEAEDGAMEKVAEPTLVSCDCRAMGKPEIESVERERCQHNGLVSKTRM